MIALIRLPSRQFTSCRQDCAPYGPWQDRAQRCSDEDVGEQVRPRLAVSPKAYSGALNTFALPVRIAMRIPAMAIAWKTTLRTARTGSRCLYVPKPVLWTRIA